MSCVGHGFFGKEKKKNLQFLSQAVIGSFINIIT